MVLARYMKKEYFRPMQRIFVLMLGLGLWACDNSPAEKAVPGLPNSSQPVGTQLSWCPSASSTNFEVINYQVQGRYRSADYSLRLVDKSRGVPASENSSAKDERILRTKIYYPTLEDGFYLGKRPIAPDGPFPVVFYSHAFSSSHQEADELGQFLATHGFITVAPNFPLSQLSAAGFKPSVVDIGSQPGDISFAIEQILARSLVASDHLYQAIDSSRIGIAGLSLGGLATSLLAHHRDYADPRVKAAAVIAGPSGIFLPSFYQDQKLPYLLLHGDQDAFVNYQRNALKALKDAPEGTHLVTFRRGSHTGFGLPIDGWLVKLVDFFVSSERAHPQNPDGIGCGFVDANITGIQAPFEALLGGPTKGVEVANPPQHRPCLGDEVERPAMNAELQMKLSREVLLAFFLSHLGDEASTRASACAYLSRGLSQEHPELSIQ